MPDGRITQVISQVLRQGEPDARVTQVISQVLRQGEPDARVTQVVALVLRKIGEPPPIPPVPPPIPPTWPEIAFAFALAIERLDIRLGKLQLGEIKLRWDPTIGMGDLALIQLNASQLDLYQDNGLASAIIISLFCDRRARADDPLPDPESYNPRGWWGDLTSEHRAEGDQLGSRLWLLERSKATRRNAELARMYIYEALQWMIDDGLAVRIDAEAEIQGPPNNQRLAMRAAVHRSDGSYLAVNFDNQWRETWEPGYHGS